MNNKFLKLLINLMLFFSTLNLCAFSIVMTTPTAINPSYFGLFFPDNTSFYAKVDSIMGVSKQKYLLDDLEVTEVIIDFSNSNKKLRLYATCLVNAEAEVSIGDMKELFNDGAVADISGDGTVADSQSSYADTMIVKTLPDMTHSNVIEYKLNLEELLLFYYEFCKHDALNDLKTDCGTRAGTKYIFTSTETM